MGEPALPVRAGRRGQSRPQAGRARRLLHARSGVALKPLFQETGMPDGRPFYITTPIYYVNGKPHIGHAYTTIACDVVARFMRLDGRPVHFLTGTDEHGQKVEKSAAEAGLSPQEFCDEIAETFRSLVQALGISNDDFIRTTEPRHIRSCV